VSALDIHILAERVAAVERHLARVAARLPRDAADLKPSSDVSDAVVLHLWQAVQIVSDLAVSLCIRMHLGAPSSYGDAFDRLARAGHLDRALADRLMRAAGFRNLVAHAYESIDLARVHEAAQHGPADLRAFIARVRDVASGAGPALGG
jgi:uncharacterized protein YutE (UPF0331/DUF86 family)